MTNPFGGPNPFQPNPFGGGAPGQQPPPPPPAPPRDEANVLATLSVVFAFVFAPAGLILGHLGLAQIRRTGQRGRDRALVGVTLSYLFITVVVVALIVRAMLPDSAPTHVAVPATTTTKPPSGTTPRPAAPPRPPIVTPSDLPGLLPSLDEVKNITGDQVLVAYEPTSQPGSKYQLVDRPECSAVFAAGAPNTYDMQGALRYYATMMMETNNPRTPTEAGQAVVAYRDAAAAQAQLEKIQAIWHQCANSVMTLLPAPDKKGNVAVALTVMTPVDAGGGISTIEVIAQQLSPRLGTYRAIAAKNNVLVDVMILMAETGGRGPQAALDVTNFILNKIPG
jgi:eukaryotic-like serine/threonine-protein kinase